MGARGGAFLLKSHNGHDYATVGGFKIKALIISGEAVTKTPLAKGEWRAIISAGARSVTVEAEGIFTGSAAETQIRHSALAGLIGGYELSFESGDRLQGDFMVARLEYSGDFNGERNYRIALASSGEVKAL